MRYEKPTVVKLGSLAELTLQLKEFGGDDGIFVVGHGSVGNVS